MTSLNWRLLPSREGAAVSSSGPRPGTRMMPGADALPGSGILPPVLLVHGFAVTARQCWEETGWVRRLGRSRDLLVVSLPWHPDPWVADPSLQSSSFPGDHAEGVRSGSVRLDGGAGEGLAEHDVAEDVTEIPDVLDLVDALAEVVREALGESGARKLDVLGYSFGARAAWTLGAEYPELVHRLVLGGLPAVDRLHQFVAGIGTGSVSEKTPAEGSEAGNSEAMDAEAMAQLADLVSASELPRADLLRFARAFSRPEFLPHPAPTPPGLLVRGTRDVLAGASDELLAALGPEPNVLELPGRTHVDALTSGVFVRSAAEFLARD